MTEKTTDTRSSYQKRSNVGLNRDFSLSRYDGFANPFEAAAAQARDKAAIVQYNDDFTKAHADMLQKHADKRAAIRSKRAR